MTASGKGILWYLVNGAMELSWFLGWAMFCGISALKRPFPFFEAVAAFSLAAIVTRLATGKGWRMISVLGLQILGLLSAALLVIHGIYYGSSGLLEGRWLLAFWSDPRTVAEWLIVVLHFLLILILWVLGATLALRPAGHDQACNRFDLGLAAFFALFIVKLIALTRGEAFAEDSLSLLFLFPFVLFGLLSIGMARIGSSASRAFLPGYRGAGVIVSFVAFVLLVTGGLFLFFLPGLTAAAQMGHRALAAAGRPLLPVLVAGLRFIFGPRSQQATEAALSFSGFTDATSIPPQTQGWFMELLTRVLGWGLWGLMLLFLLAGLLVVLIYVVRWLLSRTQGEARRKRSFPAWLAERFAGLRVFWKGIWRKMQRGIGGYPRAAELYGALLIWAGRSGLPHRCGETPLEFARRLAARFPGLGPQIGLIVGAYNREVYGEAVLDGAPLAELNAAWRFLRSPLRWPARLKARLFDTPPGETFISLQRG